MDIEDSLLFSMSCDNQYDTFRNTCYFFFFTEREFPLDPRLAVQRDLV